MLEQVCEIPAVYRFRGSEQKELDGNCYVLFSGGELLLIDPPVKEEAACRELAAVLEEQQDKYQRLRVAFTHLHGEGMGRIPEYLPCGTTIYLCRQETLFAKGEDPCQYLNRRFRREGYPKERKWRCHRPEEESAAYIHQIPVGEGDIIPVGEYTLRCLYTPGHTLGHICLFLEQEQLLFTGDTVLWDAMPRMAVWRGKISAVEAYLDSLERLKEVSPVQVFPGRGNWKGSFSARLDVLIRQCYFRLLELYQLVNDHPGSSAYALSEWFVHCKEDWSDTAEKQRWYAMSETLAHLIYLRNCGYVSAVRGKQGIVNMPGNRRLTDS